MESPADAQAEAPATESVEELYDDAVNKPEPAMAPAAEERLYKSIPQSEEEKARKKPKRSGDDMERLD